MKNIPSRLEIYTVGAGVAASIVSTMIAYNAMIVDERRESIERINSRINSTNNRIDILDGNLTSLTHAVITRYPELQDTDSD